MPQPRKSIWIGRGNNSNALAVERAQAAQRTAQSIAADRRAARDTALQNVHLEVNQLTALPPGEDEYVVERLVPARFQPVTQSRWPRFLMREETWSDFLRRRGVLREEHEPRTIFQYANGRDEYSSNPQLIRVAEQLRGWVLTDVVEAPDVTSRIVTLPTQNRPRDMVVVSDHRSWGGGIRPHYPGPADLDPPNMIGVLDNRSVHWGSQAIEGISDVPPHATAAFTNARIEKLHEIADALAQLRENATPPPPGP